jgi:ribosomal protein S18 acetylase RimI-like enzyme
MLVKFVYCDFTDETHREKFVMLINHYMADPMGGSNPLSPVGEVNLLNGFENHPASFAMFAVVNGEIAGMVTCFVNFSTFKAKYFLNIHDLIVLNEFRGWGIGRKLMERCIEIATERDYCKITLEVREDNLNAKELYANLGFKDTEPVMHFWTKVI